MLRFIQWINYRNATLGHLDALLMMYPRKRQFFRDFPKLKQMVREHFEKGVPSASTALIGATSIIEGFLRQLTTEEKQATANALAASDPRELEKLAERRIGGEKDQPGDKVFFATRLSAVAIIMAEKMARVNALQREEYEHLAAAIEQTLDAPGLGLVQKFRIGEQRVQADLPSCLNRLKTTFVSASKQEEQPRSLIFSIACPACGGTRFLLREVRHGDSPTGIYVCCVQCATEEEVFDGLVHGYDGKLGHTDYLDGPREVRDLVSADGGSLSVENLFATFTYNPDPSELEEISREDGIPVIELYDWFELSVKKSITPAERQEYETVWDYECA